MGTETASHANSGATFLVVEDHKGVASTYRRILRLLGDVTLAHDLAGALDALASRPHWTALLIDWHLPDGSGLDLITACRQRHGNVPTLVFTGDICNEVVNLAYDLDVEIVSKPMGEARLTGFARRAMAMVPAGADPVVALVRDWHERYELTSAEAFIFRSVLRGTSREALAEMLRVELSTVKKHVHNLVQKTGDPSLDAAVIRAQREIIDRKDGRIFTLG